MVLAIKVVYAIAGRFFLHAPFPIRGGWIRRQCAGRYGGVSLSILGVNAPECWPVVFLTLASSYDSPISRTKSHSSL